MFYFNVSESQKGWTNTKGMALLRVSFTPLGIGGLMRAMSEVLTSPLPLFMHLFFCRCPWGIAHQGQESLLFWEHHPLCLAERKCKPLMFTYARSLFHSQSQNRTYRFISESHTQFQQLYWVWQFQIGNITVKGTTGIYGKHIFQVTEVEKNKKCKKKKSAGAM